MKVPLLYLCPVNLRTQKSGGVFICQKNLSAIKNTGLFSVSSVVFDSEVETSSNGGIVEGELVLGRRCKKGLSLYGCFLFILSLMTETPWPIFLFSSRCNRASFERFVEPCPPSIIVFDHLWSSAFFQQLKARFPNAVFVMIHHNVEAQVIDDKLMVKGIGRHIRRIFKRQMSLYEEKIRADSHVNLFLSLADAEQSGYGQEDVLDVIDPVVDCMFDRNGSPKSDLTVVGFIGSDRYFPNSEAIGWLLSEVGKPDFPGGRLQVRFAGHMTSAIQEKAAALKSDKRHVVVFDGFMTDLELDHWIMRCNVIVVPVKLGSGIKVKAIQALELGVPVVVTPEVASGLGDNKKLLPQIRGYDEQSIQIPDLANNQILEMIRIKNKNFLNHYKSLFSKLVDKIYV